MFSSLTTSDNICEKTTNIIGRFLNVNDMKDSDLHRRLIGFLEGKASSGDWDKIKKLAENEEFVTVLRQMDKLSRESCRPDKGRMWTEIYRYVRISRRRNFIRRWERVAVVLLPALLFSVFPAGTAFHTGSGCPESGAVVPE